MREPHCVPICGRTGLEYLEQIAGSRVSRLDPSLRQGEALLVGPAVLSDAPVVVEVLEDQITRTPTPELMKTRCLPREEPSQEYQSPTPHSQPGASEPNRSRVATIARPLIV